MIRGTTPQQIIRFPMDVSNFQEIYITYKQRARVVFEKTLQDCTVDEKQISFNLTQEETLSLDPALKVYIQVRAKTNAGEAMASKIFERCVADILKEGVI